MRAESCQIILPFPWNLVLLRSVFVQMRHWQVCGVRGGGQGGQENQMLKR